MKSEREVALEILLEIEENNAYSNIAINKFLRKYQISEGAFVREIVYGVIENKLFLDYLLSQFVQTGLKKLKKEVLLILRMGIYQLAFLTGTPSYAVVNESVKLAKKHSQRHAGFINAVMRNYLRKKDTIVLPKREDDLIRYLSVKYSYEPWMIDEWLKHFSEEFTEALLKAGNETPPLTIRVNTLNTKVSAMQSLLEERGVEVISGKYVQEALIVKGNHLIDNDLFNKGLYQIQDESSMLAVKALDPKPKDLVIDVCAAPGGKTIFTGELMENKGRIIARDIYPHKLELLKDSAMRHGVDIIETQIFDALIKDAELEGKADKVLVDAPCSGLGVIRRKPEIKYNRHREELEQFSALQCQILDNASTYLKKGGTLVYSTCTISSYENEQVVRRFLDKHTDFKLVKPEHSDFNKINLQNDPMIQLFPNIHDTDGFFICKLLKMNDNTAEVYI
ncbi:MAG: 16S rRNA (cytosine(967)-C(5))-methyltransferase RsmB [Clostridiales bacterium]|nr:16S rRNA (cytosine(967)-C(5))-methyltransferase RsmB [Clostridiales bacterium]